MTAEKCSEPKKVPTWMDIWPQVLAAVIVSCGNVQAGILLSHSGVLIPQLADDDNIVGFDRDAASWIAGLCSISAIIGALGGPILDKIGRKKTLILSQIPILINWIIMSSTYYSIWPLYVARSIGGIGAGLMGVVIYVYIAELAHSQYRAPLVILNSLTSASGVLVASVIGAALEWHIACIIFGIINLCIAAAFFLVPESPYWMAYFKKSPPEEIEIELRKLNRPQWLFQEAWNDIQAVAMPAPAGNVERSRSEALMVFISVLKDRTTYIPLVLIVFIFIFQQVSGVYLFVFYSANIFASLGKTTLHGYEIPVDAAVISMGVLRVITTIASAILSKYFSKNAIMISSGLVTAVSAAATAIFMALNGIENVDIESTITDLPPATNELNSLLATASLLIFVAAGGMGMMVFPWTLASDLFSTAVRAFGNTFAMIFGNFTLFVVVKSFPYWLDLVSLPAIFAVFAGTSLCFVAFVWLFIPNTSNKSFEELSKTFAKEQIKITQPI